MESSHIFGGSEECHSNESGWTMYIGSPSQGEGDDDDDDDENEQSCTDFGHTVGNQNNTRNREDESDDSMASDASSGPSRSERSPGKAESGKEKRNSKDKKQVMTRKEEKKGNYAVVGGKGGKFGVKSGEEMARRNSWIGKRK